MELITLVTAGVLTWLLRASFIVGPAGDRMLPAATDSLIGHLRPAILGALVASAFMARAGGDVRAIPASWLVAALATAFVASRQRGLAAAAGTGLGVVALAMALGFAV